LGLFLRIDKYSLVCIVIEYHNLIPIKWKKNVLIRHVYLK